MPERDAPADEPDGWERHRREQLLAIARGTTPEQRLAWLEEAIAFAHRAGALPKREEGDAGG